MKFVDFFSGIGGIRLGLENAGHKCVGFCEFDKFARQSYTAMYDTEGEWTSSDVRTVKPYELPAADLWCFGFPCQDISVAGKQKGLQEGERSGLFYEIMRLLAGRRQEDKPRWLLIENVKNLLSVGNGFDFARLLLELGGLGYSCEWQVLNSKDFGVPQNRERVFIVASLGAGSGRKVFPIAAADGENPCELQEITQNVADAYRVYDGNGISRAVKSTDGGGGAATGLYTLPCRISKPMGQGSSAQLGIKEVNNKVAGCLSSRYYKGLSENGCNAVIIAPERKTEAAGVLIAANTITKKTEEACTLDACYYKSFGCNQARTGVMVAPVATPDYANKHQNGRRLKEVGGEMFTLTAQAPHGVTDGVRIRKLTPRECWRLQGFPDEYFDKAKAAGVSDSQLYKQAGNAVTVNVAEAIGKRLKEIENERD